MQFGILLLGVLVFSYYQFANEPLFFNQTQLTLLSKTRYADSLKIVMTEYDALQKVQKDCPDETIPVKIRSRRTGCIKGLTMQHRVQTKTVWNIKSTMYNDGYGTKTVNGDANDTNYIFLRFVVDHLPEGVDRFDHCCYIFCRPGDLWLPPSMHCLQPQINDIHKRWIKVPYETEKREYYFSPFVYAGMGHFLCGDCAAWLIISEIV